MKMTLTCIELDASIQCRADIDTGVVNEYADRMSEGDQFPPVELFGTKSECWIGDGWHRIMAAKQIGAESIAANLHHGGRVEALKHALSANAVHGHRRTNADKRRCVEIALKEFPKLSSRTIAGMCGVSHTTVESLRNDDQLAKIASSTVMSKDGKERPAHPKRDIIKVNAETGEELEVQTDKSKPKLGPPCDGMQFARLAIMDLEQIRNDDVEREQAFDRVERWIQERRPAIA